MKKILLFISVVLVSLAFVVFLKTTGLKSKQLSVRPALGIAIDTERAAEKLAKAIQFKTISNQEPSQFDYPQFIDLHALLAELFPNVHRKLKKELVNEYSLLYTWEGTAPELKPMLLMAHMDVVPIEPGTENKWNYPPFAGRIVEGYIWGRGALDDKASLMGILEAAEFLLAEGYLPRRTIYLAFGHDEEVGGTNGAAKIAEILESRGVQLEYVLDEGGAIIKGVVPGLSESAALVGIAEKGYLSVELVVAGQGGHSSMPPPHTTVGILSTAIHHLERNQFGKQITGATKQMFEHLGPHMPFALRMLFANPWLFGTLIKSELAQSPPSNSLIRTTIAATMLEGSPKENVLPREAKAVINFRILPGDTIDGIVAHVRKAINDERVRIRVMGKGRSPSAVSDVNSASYGVLARSILQIFPDVVVAPFLVVGGTDSRHYEEVSENIYRFLPIRLVSEDYGRLHGTNERIAVENYTEIIRFYLQLIRNFNR